MILLLTFRVSDAMDRATALVVTLRHNDEDLLVSQAKAFIANTLVT